MPDWVDISDMNISINIEDEEVEDPPVFEELETSDENHC